MPENDALAVREVLARYAWHVDRREWDAWRALFAPDAVWASVANGEHRGQDDFDRLVARLDRLVTADPPTRHLISNELVKVDGDAAVARCYVTSFVGDVQRVRTAGEYRIELVRGGDGWRIRRLDLALHRPTPT